MNKTKRSVLIVDDEPRVLRFISASLSLAGFEVSTCTNGEEALKLAQQDKFDIIVLDLVMSPVSGFQVLKKLRAFSRVPVIAFSARTDFSDLAMENGADEFISKPFRPDELVKKIQEVACLMEAEERLPLG